MKHIVVRGAKALLRKCGYSIVRVGDPSPLHILPTHVDQELDSTTCDAIWSEDGFIDRYLSNERIRFFDAIIDCIQKHVDVQTINTVVDVGCGPGYMLKLIAELNSDAKLVGLDFSPEVLNVARGICPSATFLEHDIYEEIEGPYELAICTEVLEHLDYPARALDRLAQSSQHIMLTVPNGRKDTFLRHINFWSMRSWEIFLEPYAETWECESCYLCGDDKIATFMRKRA